MALILENYDVSTGETRTSTITAPATCKFQVLTTDFIGRVYFYVQTTQAGGQWIAEKDENNNPIRFSIESGKDNGINIQGFGGSDISILVVPSGTCTGTISIDVISS